MEPVREGFAYLRGRKVLQSTFLLDIIAMVFGMPRALFPVLALTRFHEGSEVVGLLFAAPAVGAFIGARRLGGSDAITRARGDLGGGRLGRGDRGVRLVGSNLWLGLFFLAVAGAADVISAVFRNTILQVTVPEHLRGRLSGSTTSSSPAARGSATSRPGSWRRRSRPIVSVVSGGLLCIAGAGLVAWRVPSLRRYQAGDRA